MARIFGYFVVCGLGPEIRTLDGNRGFRGTLVMYLPSLLDQYPPNHTLYPPPLPQLPTLRVPTRPDDEWKGQISHIGRGTYGKTQGQSRKHRERQDPTSLESISTRLYEAVSILNRMELQHKKDMRKVKLEQKQMRKAFCGDSENSTSSNDSEQESNGSNYDDSQQMDTDNDG